MLRNAITRISPRKDRFLPVPLRRSTTASSLPRPARSTPTLSLLLGARRRRLLRWCPKGKPRHDCQQQRGANVLHRSVSLLARKTPGSTGPDLRTESF